MELITRQMAILPSAAIKKSTLKNIVKKSPLRFKTIMAHLNIAGQILRVIMSTIKTMTRLRKARVPSSFHLKNIITEHGTWAINKFT